jgi:hypothetical protein
MDFVYVLIYGNEWDDIIIYLSEADALEASIKNPNARVGIFSNNGKKGYEPTYNYFENGKYINHL